MDMISKFLFERVSLPDLELSLDAYSSRQKVLSNNIANAKTPGYRAQRVKFEEEYNKYKNNSELTGTKTDPAHLSLGAAGDLAAISLRPELARNRKNDSGINNVDIDHEMAELAKNSLRYEMSTTLYTQRMKDLRAAIRGR